VLVGVEENRRWNPSGYVSASVVHGSHGTYMSHATHLKRTRYKFDGRLEVNRITVVTASLAKKECRVYARPVG